MNIDLEKLCKIVEAALFAAGVPLSIEKIISLFDENEKPDKKTICEILEQLKNSYVNRGIELVELASGFQFQTSKELSNWINRLWKERPVKYSNALLEILAIIAYRQPITRGEIEEIRGIQVSSAIIKTLTEHEWVRVLGYRDIPGKPALYGTTKHFLDHFGLKSLDELTSSN